MVFAPLFGYLGDRVSRKYIMAFGITVWSINTYAGSQLEEDQFGWFLVVRSLVGIGEASFSIVAPTILADLFVGDERTKALTLFNFAMPCGTGLGYICGSQLAAALKNWKWALRLTPGLGIIALLLCLFLVYEPSRGEMEAHDAASSSLQPQQQQQQQTPAQPQPAPQSQQPQQPQSSPTNRSTYITDVLKVLRIKTFVWSSVGFTCVSFASGALAVWAPQFILYAEQVHDKKVSLWTPKPIWNPWFVIRSK